MDWIGFGTWIGFVCLFKLKTIRTKLVINLKLRVGFVLFPKLIQVSFLPYMNIPRVVTVIFHFWSFRD